MAFAYEAMDAGGRQVRGVVEADAIEDAGEQLRARGLFVTRLAPSSATVAAASRGARQMMSGRPGNLRDLLMFSQQVSMMLRAGSRLVPALEAIEEQITKPAWREIVADIRQRVQTGSPLSAALGAYPQVFNQAWQAIIAAAESTGGAEEAFDRLAAMTRQQQQIRTRIIGTLAYPAALLLLSFGVLGVMAFFVLPRFDDLYCTLNTPLPWLTRQMLAASRYLSAHLATVLLAAGGLAAGGVLLVRTPAVRHQLETALSRAPLIGRLIRQLVLARILRVWGTSVHSSVPLLESLQLARGCTRHALFTELMDELVARVSEGDSVGNVLMRSPLVPRTMASAIATGEQSGQLAAALLFLADYLDNENDQLLAALTRLLEPAILVFMGVAVGIVAVSLFLPLFDLTAAA